jgi:ADP-heptose:LPS heptosyltransferase
LERHRDIGAVFTIPARGSDEDNNVTGVVDAVNAGTDGLDYVFDIHDVTLSRCVLRRINAKEKVKYNKDAIKRLLLAGTGIDLLPTPTLSVIEKYSRALVPAGVKKPDYGYRIEIDEERAKQFADVNNLEQGYIAIAPRALYETKSWQRENFKTVIEKLSKLGYRTALFNDEPLGEWGKELIEAGAADVSGKTPLEILPEALSGAGAIVCNDSALAHLGPLLGVPVIDIFGPTSPRFGFAPRGDKDVTLFAEFPCSPCTRHGKRNCWRGDNACLAAISPGQVVEEVEKVIEGA